MSAVLIHLQMCKHEDCEEFADRVEYSMKWCRACGSLWHETNCGDTTTGKWRAPKLINKPSILLSKKG